mmetsp:Transcript_39534/g.111857  ORF Transcript_39534/g.111857 Transcript_39534/m.111857 type:complete len:91 (+) Transcript_39534:81-353(+)
MAPAAHIFARFPNNHLASPAQAEQRGASVKMPESGLSCGAYPGATFPNSHMSKGQHGHGYAYWSPSVSPVVSPVTSPDSSPASSPRSRSD